jgi:hypothetical protein
MLVPCYLRYSAGFSSKELCTGRRIATRGHSARPELGVFFLQNRSKQMRQTVIACTTTAVVTAIVAIWGTTIIVAHNEKHPEVATASASIDVMKMMRDAKGLPEEKFDAH